MLQTDRETVVAWTRMRGRDVPITARDAQGLLGGAHLLSDLTPLSELRSLLLAYVRAQMFDTGAPAKTAFAAAHPAEADVVEFARLWGAWARRAGLDILHPAGERAPVTLWSVYRAVHRQNGGADAVRAMARVYGWDAEHLLAAYAHAMGVEGHDELVRHHERVRDELLLHGITQGMCALSHEG